MARSGSSIYHSLGDLDAAFARLGSDRGVSKENRELILKYCNTWLAKGVTRARVVKIVYCLRRLSNWFKKPFSTASKDELIVLVGEVEKQGLAESTRYDIKIVLKTFFRWLKGSDDQYPPEVAWLKPKMRHRNHRLPEEMLSEEEVLKMAQVASTARDKAIVLVLYETGCRIGELLSLKIKNVQFDQYGAILRVTGKTGDRRVRIVSSAPALAAWLDVYEGRNDPEAVLWPPRSNNNHATNFPMTHSSACHLLLDLAARAGINKHVHPHLFRHSRATFLASRLTESQMKEYLGWVQASSMASVYVHLSGRNVDNAMLALQGFAKPEDKQEEQFKVKFCQRCNEKNSPAAKFCLRCGTPTDAVLIQAEVEKKVGDNVMDKLMQDAEFKDFLYKKVVQLGLDKQLA